MRTILHKKPIKIGLELSKLGNKKEWFLTVEEEGNVCQERTWIIGEGKKEKVEELIKKIREL